MSYEEKLKLLLVLLDVMEANVENGDSKEDAVELLNLNRALIQRELEAING